MSRNPINPIFGERRNLATLSCVKCFLPDVVASLVSSYADSRKTEATIPIPGEDQQGVFLIEPFWIEEHLWCVLAQSGDASGDNGSKIRIRALVYLPPESGTKGFWRLEWEKVVAMSPLRQRLLVFATPPATAKNLTAAPPPIAPCLKSGKGKSWKPQKERKVEETNIPGWTIWIVAGRMQTCWKLAVGEGRILSENQTEVLSDIFKAETGAGYHHRVDNLVAHSWNGKILLCTHTLCGVHLFLRDAWGRPIASHFMEFADGLRSDPSPGWKFQIVGKSHLLVALRMCEKVNSAVYHGNLVIDLNSLNLQEFKLTRGGSTNTSPKALPPPLPAIVVPQRGPVKFESDRRRVFHKTHSCFRVIDYDENVLEKQVRVPLYYAALGEIKKLPLEPF